MGFYIYLIMPLLFLSCTDEQPLSSSTSEKGDTRPLSHQGPPLNTSPQTPNNGPGPQGPNNGPGPQGPNNGPGPQGPNNKQPKTAKKGLVNLGNTCFANSSINLLFSSALIKDALKKSTPKIAGQTAAELAAREGFQKAMSELFNARKKRQEKLCTELNAFYDAFEKARKELLGSELADFKDKIRKDQSDARAFIEDILGFLGTPQSSFSYVRFPDGSIKTYREDNRIVSLGLDSKTQNISIAELVTQWAAPQAMTGVNKVEHDSGVKMDAQRFNALKMPGPDSLYLSLNRFEYNLTGGEPKRLSNKIIPSKSIKISAADEKDIKKTDMLSYELRVIVIQVGTMKGGHYYAYVFNKATNQWTKFDDSSVKTVDEAEVMKDATDNGYVFLYEKVK